MKVWMLLLTVICYSASASEFTHIKLNPEFEQYLTRTETKSPVVQKSAAKTKSVSALSAGESPLQSIMMNALMDTSSGSFLKGGFNPINSPAPYEGELSPIYDEIRRHLDGAHQQLLTDQVQSINRFNQQFNLGSSNFSGFSWQKPFGVVQVYADRQVTPNIWSNNWLVADTFTFEIEATTFLERLTQAGLTGMSAIEIGAFAGITFKRSYTYWHYANSYQDGLVSDSTMLFLPFLKFNSKGMEAMGAEEMMKREDMWTARAGGLITTPPFYGVSASGGVLAALEYQNITTVQNVNQEQKYQVGVLSKKTVNAGATLELQLDFFKLLKFSLLRADLNYEYSSGKEFTLGFTLNQWNNVKADKDQEEEFKSILRGFGSVKKLETYVIRLDEKESEALDKRGSILLWGKMQKQKTEQVRIIKDNVVKVFYKNYSQNVKYIQDFMSKLFAAAIYQVFKIPYGAGNASVYSRQIAMEYEASHPQAVDPKIARIDNAEQFSFVLTQSYNASRTDRWSDKGVKNDLIWFVDNFTTLAKSYKSDIKNNVIKGPMYIESNVRVEKAGFQYLIDSSENNVFAHIAFICKSKRASDWADERDRKEMLKRLYMGADGCVKDIGKKYLAFKKDYSGNFLKPSLAKFKDFIAKYYKKAGTLESIQLLFGVENTFINGRLQAATGLGMTFNTTFSSGQFRGLGVIDNFKRSTGSRAPANIVSE